MLPLSKVGLVVIGRNEADNLNQCFRAIEGANVPMVYVDSGSSDGSVDCARDAGVVVRELSTDLPFSASRARNEGLWQLVASHPEIEYIQFLDGDCVIDPSWLTRGAEFLDKNARHGIVFGHLAEREPQRSIYNRLCALEWRSRSGEVLDFGSLGGIFMVRVNCFVALNGFNTDIIAGEDSEFGLRAYLQGFKTEKIAGPMASHDAAMYRFSQWWRRALRSGHAIGQRYDLHGKGPMRDCASARRSVLVWAVAFPLVLLITFSVFGLLWSLLAGAAGYFYLGYRIFSFRTKTGDSPSDAVIYSLFTIVAKFAQVFGLFKYYKNRSRNSFAIIE